MEWIIEGLPSLWPAGHFIGSQKCGIEPCANCLLIHLHADEDEFLTTVPIRGLPNCPHIFASLAVMLLLWTYSQPLCLRFKGQSFSRDRKQNEIVLSRGQPQKAFRA